MTTHCVAFLGEGEGRGGRLPLSCPGEEGREGNKRGGRDGEGRGEERGGDGERQRGCSVYSGKGGIQRRGKEDGGYPVVARGRGRWREVPLSCLGEGGVCQPHR